VRFDFRELPSATGGQLTPRPVIDVWMEGLAVTPLACLVDSGALRTRFDRELAELAGIEPDDTQSESFTVGGYTVTGAPARVTLRIEAGRESHTWDAAVWFCDPWALGFQLLGLDGFFRHLRVTISAYDEWVDCKPMS
jgi:hypothetical protein